MEGLNTTGASEREFLGFSGKAFLPGLTCSVYGEIDMRKTPCSKEGLYFPWLWNPLEDYELLTELVIDHVLAWET